MPHCHTYHRLLPGVGAQGIDEVVLATRGRPYGRELAETRGEREVAQHAEDEAVQERYRTSRGQDETDGARERDPGANPTRARLSALTVRHLYLEGTNMSIRYLVWYY